VTRRSIGPGVVLGFLVVGVLVGERVGPSSARGALASGLTVAVTSIWCAATGRRIVGLALCCAGACLIGGALMCRALDGQAHSVLTGPVIRRESATITVTLLEDPAATRFSARALARVEHFRRGRAGARPAGRTVAVDADGDAATRLGVLDAGDRVELSGYFRPLNEFEAWLRWRHAVGAFSAHELSAFREGRSLLARVANGLRGRVLSGLRPVAEPQRALLAGFLLGDTTDLPSSVIADFRAAGLSHLVAVSGQNVAFVLALTGPLLHRSPRWIRLGGGLLVLVVFAALTGWEASVLRASTMAACSMTALTVGRPTFGVRALGLAVIALLLVDPFLVHSVAFLLSCAASLGIALLGPAVAARTPGPRVFAEMLGVTVGAQLGVAPLLVVVFGEVPLIAVPANLLVATVSGPLTTLGLAGGIIGGLVTAAPLGAVLSFPAFLCATYVLAVARWCAGVPLALGLREVAAGGLVVVATFAVRRARRATWRRARTGAPEPRVAVPHR
jgi:competence protein ComEC